jgi:hypothetical protein
LDFHCAGRAVFSRRLGNGDLYSARRPIANWAERSWFAFVVSCVECLFFPFGTILGVFPIIVLSRESAKALFSAETAQVPG